MARYERVEDILRLAIEMQNSYQGFSIQDIQDEFEVSRRTAIRMKDTVERLFPSMEKVQNPMSRIKKWRLNKTSLNKMISFTAEELAELENCKSIMKNMNYTNRCDLLSEIMAKINMINESKSLETDIEALLEVEGYAIRQHPRYKMNLYTLNVISDAIKSYKYLSFTFLKSLNILSLSKESNITFASKLLLESFFSNKSIRIVSIIFPLTN